MFPWLRRVTRLRLARRRAGVVARRDLGYRPGSAHPKHRLDVYLPPAPRGAPVVHFVHGGYWIAGDKDHVRPLTGLYGSIGQALAARGVITVVQSYRLVPEVTIEGLLDDVVAALHYTKEQLASWGGDPSRLFVMGHSAGGHVTALLAADRAQLASRGFPGDTIRGYIPISAIWDIADMARAQDGPFQQKITIPVFGRDAERRAAYSPLTHLSAETPPLLVVVGARDYPYLIPQAERARDALAAIGRPPAYHVATDSDHDDVVLRFGARNDNMTDVVVRFVTAW